MHKLEQAWQRAALNRKWFEASYAYFNRIRNAAGAKGLLAATEHPSERTALRVALARQAVVRPEDGAADAPSLHEEGSARAGNDDDDAPVAPGSNVKDWCLTQGVAFRLRWQPQDQYHLAADAAQRAALQLRRGAIYLYGDQCRPSGFAEFYSMLLARLEGASPEAMTHGKGTYSPGPVGNFGNGIGQTLWVTAPTKGRDFDQLLGAPLDGTYAQDVARQLREAYARGVEEALAEHATDEAIVPRSSDGPPVLAFPRADTDLVRQTLLTAFDVTDPLDVYEGWQRQQAWDIVNRISLQVNYGGEASAARFGAVLDIYPRPDDSAHALSWVLHPAPAREVLLETLWPRDEHNQGPKQLPTDLAAPEAWRYLAAWQTFAMSLAMKQDSPAATSGLEAALRGEATLVAMASVRECWHFKESWTARAQEWLLQLELPSNIVLRVNPALPGHKAVALPAPLVRKALHDVARRFADREGLPYDPQMPVAVALSPSADELGRAATLAQDESQGETPVDTQPATLETLVFGRYGSRLMNNVDDWPEDLSESFYKATNERDLRGPAVALRRGLGTWMRQALTPSARALLADVLLRYSPLALRPSATLGPVLAELPEWEARSIGELLGCQVVNPLWGYEFSWALAFALGGAAHACVSVRPALQERLQHTRIDNDVPAWTLQGPAALTYVEFAEPIQTHLERQDKVQVRHLLLGAYLWTQECDAAGVALRREDAAKEDTQLNLGLALVSVMHYTRTDEPASDVHTYPSFRQYGWRGLNPENSLNELLAALAKDLAQQRRADELRYGSQNAWGNDPGRAKRQELAAKDTYEEALQALARVLLYMELREARLDPEDKTYGDNVGRGEHPLLRPRSPGKNKGSPCATEVTVLHRIRIGPEHFDDEASAASQPTGRTVAAHYREGHFRMQPYGPGRRDRRRQWIRPTLVGAKQLTTGLPRSYDVG